ncbi:protein CUP-SHAPED COTYLEDON 2 [Eutrema salsugineum]|uniref:protein CUP-SHAPED COTYLEDON 2 n=1 Tax=Eutrema salsugineum TaxID=72664 RepID=UPI000CECEA48|nr:protein CUP-SHAPED COTYLEDON 2 [Eutrema salsugineum]
MSMVEKHYTEDQEDVGFRFQPKVAKQPNHELELEDKDDIYDIEPWLLTHTETDFFESKELVYFVKRITQTCQGYWKATGKPKDIVSEETGVVIGRKRSLSFYVKGEKKASGWTMVEYSLHDGGSFQNQVLCQHKAP